MFGAAGRGRHGAHGTTAAAPPDLVHAANVDCIPAECPPITSRSRIAPWLTECASWLCDANAPPGGASCASCATRMCLLAVRPPPPNAPALLFAADIAPPIPGRSHRPWVHLPSTTTTSPEKQRFSPPLKPLPVHAPESGESRTQRDDMQMDIASSDHLFGSLWFGACSAPRRSRRCPARAGRWCRRITPPRRGPRRCGERHRLSSLCADTCLLCLLLLLLLLCRHVSLVSLVSLASLASTLLPLPFFAENSAFALCVSAGGGHGDDEGHVTDL